jgi:hypothetical protein
MKDEINSMVYNKKFLNFNKNKFVIFAVIYCLSGCSKGTSLSQDNIPRDGLGYPRLAMWWPDTWEQPIEDLNRYNWIGFGSWDKLATISTLKARNTDQKHFMDFSITETSWSWWQNNKKTIMEKIPAEWFLTQRGTFLADTVNMFQIKITVEAVIDKNGLPLFEIDDKIACEFETMKVIGIDTQNNILTVERGFVRSASTHLKGVRIAAHITFWPESWVMNMSSLCPKFDLNDGNGFQTWIEFACRYWQIENQEMWDGYIVDRIESEQSWLKERWCRTIDPDFSNKEVTDNYAAFNAAWYQGCTAFLEYLRSTYSDKALISNTSGAYYQTLNGSIYEGFPGNWDNSRAETYQEWADRALGENGYINVSKSGFTPNYSLTETYEDEEMPEDGLEYDNPFTHPDFIPNYQRMRYGLSTALLGDGYFSYEISTNGHGSLGLMWFDEYDNAGTARGYLGVPETDAVTIMPAGDGYIWKRVFEKGIVICNPTNTTATVYLGKNYRLIKGHQVPQINTGATVDTVTINARDGRILLN